MGIGFALYLEKSSLVDDLFTHLQNVGVNSIYSTPGQCLHLTFVNADGNDATKLVEEIQNLNNFPNSLVTEKVSFFTHPRNVAYIELNNSEFKKLIPLHKKVCNAFEKAELQIRGRYSTTNWVPHISLAGGFSSEQLEKISEYQNSFPGHELSISGYGVATWDSKEVKVAKEWFL